MNSKYEDTYIQNTVDKIKEIQADAILAINNFCKEKIITRGGRVGSGMGTLLEALWGFNMNQILLKYPEFNCEIAWFPDNEYNDFACIERDATWDPTSQRGELFRIEIKSMNRLADESKGHFDQIQQNLGKHDLLVVLVWSWKSDDGIRFSPYIDDFYINNAIDIAQLRDTLHIARGGTFVDGFNCPDRCSDTPCKHHGEALNANGKRERLSGPITTKPPGSSHASNFGGLVRMLKTSNDNMRKVFRDIRSKDLAAHDYISFIHRNFPAEEVNQYTANEWKELAKKLGIGVSLKKEENIYNIRENFPNHGYAKEIRSLY
ncbi:hypothetical protein [Bacillus tropicus]|uniref:hypothetical protein n=1 Tax=Bacillus tropicus TaxID=2026188 RepID=UPI00119FCCC1|nr:hypothetical protein [Bacillus tropicus]